MKNAEFCKKIIPDDFCRVFHEAEELFSFVKELTANDEWFTVSTDDIECVFVPDLPLLRMSTTFSEILGKEVSIVASDEAIDDTGRSTQLAMIINCGTGEEQCYLLSDSGVSSLAIRSGIAAPGPSKVYLNNKTEYKDILNTCCKYQHKKMQCLIRGEKIRAVNSFGGGNGYSVLDQYELLEAIQNNLDNDFPGNNLEQGVWSHDKLHAEWRFPCQKDALLQDYAKAITALNSRVNVSNLMPMVFFCTSDTADAAATVTARLRDEKSGLTLAIGPAMKVTHKNNRTVADFEKETSVIFSRYIQRIEHLIKLTEIPIFNPEEALCNAMYSLKLPRNYIKQAQDALDGMYVPGECTAHDLYVAMNDILFSLEKENVRKADDYAECIARVMHWPKDAWKAYDVDYLINNTTM